MAKAKTEPKNNNNGANLGFEAKLFLTADWCDRRSEVLFIDARKLGALVDRTRKEFVDEDIVLTPGRYVGAAEAEDDDVPFEERFTALQEKLEGQFAEADMLTATIREKLKGVGYGASVIKRFGGFV